jgi:hypothetical protein
MIGSLGFEMCVAVASVQQRSLRLRRSRRGQSVGGFSFFLGITPAGYRRPSGPRRGRAGVLAASPLATSCHGLRSASDGKDHDCNEAGGSQEALAPGVGHLGRNKHRP